MSSGSRAIARTPPPTWGEKEPYHRPHRPLAALSAAATVAAIAVALVRWRPSRIEIQGASMVPTLLPGDWALAVSGRQPRKGHVVVVEHPGRPDYEMVKRGHRWVIDDASGHSEPPYRRC